MGDLFKPHLAGEKGWQSHRYRQSETLASRQFPCRPAAVINCHDVRSTFVSIPIEESQVECILLDQGALSDQSSSMDRQNLQHIENYFHMNSGYYYENSLQHSKIRYPVDKILLCQLFKSWESIMQM